MEKAIFVGYLAQHKGWEFYNPLSKQFVLSDRADFDERVFPGLSTRLPDTPAFTPSLHQQHPSQTVPHVIPTENDDVGATQTRQQVGDLVGDADSSSSSSSSSSS